MRLCYSYHILIITLITSFQLVVPPFKLCAHTLRPQVVLAFVSKVQDLERTQRVCSGEKGRSGFVASERLGSLEKKGRTSTG